MIVDTTRAKLYERLRQTLKREQICGYKVGVHSPTATVLMLVAAGLRHVANTRRRTRKYPDMSRLTEHQAENAPKNTWTEIGSISGTQSVN